MRLLILLACVSLTCCQIDSKLAGQGQEKGIVDWINSWLSTTSTTTFRPVNDPPADCPTCRSSSIPECPKHIVFHIECGIARTRRRIVGGYETKKLEIPWIVVLMYNGRFYCGGSLINDLYVLTAAHCVSGFRKEKMSVRFLEHDRSTANETKTVDRKVQAIIRHARYNPGNYDNDIALLKLNERVDLSTALKRAREDVDDDKDVGIRPGCLPTAGLSYSNRTAMVAGWGTTEEGGSVSSTLQAVKVPIISNEECRKTDYKNRITDNMLCAGEQDGGRDACQGDSGGPLHVVEEGSEKHSIVGVVSWGEGCARPNKPGVYSRVNRYLTWIKSNTRDACYCP